MGGRAVEGLALRFQEQLFQVARSSTHLGHTDHAGEARQAMSQARHGFPLGGRFKGPDAVDEHGEGIAPGQEFRDESEPHVPEGGFGIVGIDLIYGGPHECLRQHRRKPTAGTDMPK